MSHLVDIQPWLLMHPGNDVLAPEEMKAATKIMGKLLRGYIDFTGALIESYVDFAKEEITPEVVVAIGKLAAAGNLSAQTCIGILFEHGLQFPLSTRRAYRAAYKALWVPACRGYAPAQYWLGLLYVLGEGCRKSYKKAAEWFLKAAEQGYSLAQHDLGILYRDGLGVPASEHQAAIWFRRAAEQDLDRAKFKLAELYEKGKIARSIPLAMQWYERLAEVGYIVAQYRLGMMYYKNRNISQAEGKLSTGS